MNQNLPNPHDLSYFLEVVKLGNLSRAAERLGLTQPSLSVAIQRLESVFSANLLIRSKQGVKPTPAGRRVYYEAQTIIEEMERLKSKVLQSELEIAGEYRIGAHPSVALYALPRAISKVINEYPSLEVKLVHDLSRKITEKVISLEVDLGIVVNPVSHPDLIIQKVGEDHVTFWESQQISSKNDEWTLICDDQLMQTESLMRKIKSFRSPPKRVITSSNLEVISSLTAKGAGIGILPTRVAQLYHSNELKAVKGAPVFRDVICTIMRTEGRRILSLKKIQEEIGISFSTK